MPIQFGGLASGLDTSSMITQLVALERIPINNLNTKKLGLTGDITRIGAISSSLSALEDTLGKLGDSQGFRAYSAVSSEEADFTVTADSNAQAGEFRVRVRNLAETAKYRSNGYDPGHTFRDGSIDFTVWDGDTVRVDIPRDATIHDVKDLINDSDAEVSATVVNDGTREFLSITSNKSGHPIGTDPTDALEIDVNMGGGGRLRITNRTQTAENARVDIDGLPVYSPSNTVSGAVEGVTFELLGVGGNEKATIAEDNEKIKEHLAAFVDAYNAAIEAIKAQNDEGAERRALGDFGRAVSQASADGPYPNLASVGISTTATGKLSIDDEALSAALTDDVDAVAKVFGDTNGVVPALTGTIDRYTKSDGVLDAMEDAANASIKRIESSIERKELSVDRFEARLTRQFSVMERLIAQMNDQSGQFASMLLLTPQSSQG